MFPYLLHSGHLYLPTFGALAALGLMAALTLSLKTAARVGLSPDMLWNAGSFAVLAAFVLSRLLLVVGNFRSFMAYPVYLLAVPSLTPMGLLLTLVAVGVWLWFHQVSILAALDAWVSCATLTWAFLAVGHFAEGSDLGLPTSAWIGIALPGTTTRMIPVALFASLAALAITLFLLWDLGVFHGFRSRRKECIPQGLKPASSQTLNAKAEALAYLEAKQDDRSIGEDDRVARRLAGRTFALGLGISGLAQFLLSFWREPGLDGVLGDMLDPLQWVAVGMMVFAVGVWVLAEPAPTRTRTEADPLRG